MYVLPSVPNRVIAPPLYCGLLILLALSTGGCADCPTCPDGGFDSGVALDAGFEQPPGADAGRGFFRDANPVDFQDAAADDRNESGWTDGACSNGLDDDSSGAFDCDDQSCAATPYCCVGSATEACCEMPTVLFSIDIMTCPDGAVTDCTGFNDGNLFGSPLPRIDQGHLLVSGESGDSGLAFGPEIDPRGARVKLSATLRIPEGCAIAPCVDNVMVGFGPAPSSVGLSTTPALYPADVALVARVAQADIGLFVGGERVWTRVLAAGARVVTLTLTPEGEVIATIDGARLPTGHFEADENLRALAFGRTPNLPAANRGQSAGISALSLSAGACPILGIGSRADESLPLSAEVEMDRLGSASVIAQGAERAMVYDNGGDLHLARLDPVDGLWKSVGASPLISALDEERLSDPDLLVGDGYYALYFTLWQRGIPSLWMRRSTNLPGLQSATSLALTTPSGVLLASSSTLLRPDGSTWLAATALSEEVNDEGELTGRLLATQIRLLSSSDGISFSLHSDEPIAETQMSFDAFDRDEIYGPELVEDTSEHLRLYYGGRRGNRWSIGEKISVDGDAWRVPEGGAPILTGSRAGYDALSVMNPSVTLGDVTLGDAGRLYYTGHNGSASALGSLEIMP